MQSILWWILTTVLGSGFKLAGTSSNPAYEKGSYPSPSPYGLTVGREVGKKALSVWMDGPRAEACHGMFLAVSQNDGTHINAT